MANPQISNGLLFDALTGTYNLDPVLQQTQAWLQDFAATPNFTDKMQLAFGDSANVADWRDSWLNGSLGTLPEIEVRPAAK